MTSISMPDELAHPVATTARRRLVATVRATLVRFIADRRKRRAERLTLLELSRFDDRRLRDLGIDPLDIYDALHGQRSPSVLFDPMRRDQD